MRAGVGMRLAYQAASAASTPPAPACPRKPAMSLETVEKLIKDHKVEFVDLRFADMRGVQHHVPFPKSIVDASLFADGKMLDGSSIYGWPALPHSHPTR